jgi:predicted Fe-S protein YdhL (DUF1289 family)
MSPFIECENCGSPWSTNANNECPGCGRDADGAVTWAAMRWALSALLGANEHTIEHERWNARNVLADTTDRGPL